MLATRLYRDFHILVEGCEHRRQLFHRNQLENAEVILRSDTSDSIRAAFNWCVSAFGRGARDSSATPVRPVQEELAVAESGFGILIDRDDDRLRMMVAVALQSCLAPHICQCLDPRWIVGVVVVPSGRLVGHRSALFCTWVRSAREIVELCSLSRNQETGRGIIETGALQLANGAGEFGNLRAQLQNPERQGDILHPVPGSISRSLFSR